MKQVLTLTLILCLVALAAGGTAAAPKQATSIKPHVTSYKPQTAALGTESITIPQMLSYQGKLTDTLGVPVSDTTYQVTFRFYSVPTGGASFWSETQTVRTKNGLFSALLGSVAQIESVPSSGSLYLGMAVAGGAELTPRLRLVGSAYSYLAGKSANSDLLQGKDTTGFVRTGQTNSVTSNMIVDGTIAAADLGQMGASSGQVMKWTGSAWAPRNDSVGGGGGGDNAWVRVGSDSVLYTVHNLGLARGGANSKVWGDSAFSHVNFGIACTTGASGQAYNYATVGGGYHNVASYMWSTVAGGYGNTASLQDATVGGGTQNIASGNNATVAGGMWNRATGNGSAIVGGEENTASGFSSIVGGYYDTASAYYGGALSGHRNVGGDAVGDTGAVVAGGCNNRAIGLWSSISGGDSNIASGNYSAVAGGYYDRAYGWGSGIISGRGNIAGNAAVDTGAVVAGGTYNKALGKWSYIGGGDSNTVSLSSVHATVGGGKSNTASNNYAAVVGGYNDSASGANSFVGGGTSNTASATDAVIGGGAATARPATTRSSAVASAIAPH